MLLLKMLKNGPFIPEVAYRKKKMVKMFMYIIFSKKRNTIYISIETLVRNTSASVKKCSQNKYHSSPYPIPSIQVSPEKSSRHLLSVAVH